MKLLQNLNWCIDEEVIIAEILRTDFRVSKILNKILKNCLSFIFCSCSYDFKILYLYFKRNYKIFGYFDMIHRRCVFGKNSYFQLRSWSNEDLNLIISYFRSLIRGRTLLTFLKIATSLKKSLQKMYEFQIHMFLRQFLEKQAIPICKILLYLSFSIFNTEGQIEVWIEVIISFEERSSMLHLPRHFHFPLTSYRCKWC